MRVVCGFLLLACLACACAATNAIGDELREDLLGHGSGHSLRGLKPGVPSDSVSALLSLAPTLEDSLGQVYEWNLTSAERARLETYGSGRLKSVIINVSAEDEGRCLLLYESLERHYRSQWGEPALGRFGDYRWRVHKDSLELGLRLLPDKKRLTVQLSDYRKPSS